MHGIHAKKTSQYLKYANLQGHWSKQYNAAKGEILFSSVSWAPSTKQLASTIRISISWANTGAILRTTPEANYNDWIENVVPAQFKFYHFKVAKLLWNSKERTLIECLHLAVGKKSPLATSYASENSYAIVFGPLFWSIADRFHLSAKISQRKGPFWRTCFSAGFVETNVIFCTTSVGTKRFLRFPTYFVLILTPAGTSCVEKPMYDGCQTILIGTLSSHIHHPQSLDYDALHLLQLHVYAANDETSVPCQMALPPPNTKKRSFRFSSSRLCAQNWEFLELCLSRIDQSFIFQMMEPSHNLRIFCSVATEVFFAHLRVPTLLPDILRR